MKPKCICITTVPISMNKALIGQLDYINNYFEVVGITSYVEKDINEIKEREGIRMLFVEMKRNISLYNDLKSLKALYKAIKNEKPLIVHTHTPKAGLLGMAAAFFAKVPVRIHTVAGMPLMEASPFKKSLLFITERLTYFFAVKVQPNSEGLKAFILSKKLTSKNKIGVIGHGSSNGVNLHYYSREETIKKYGNRDTLRYNNGVKDSREFVFCFIGRLAVDKGIQILIEEFLKIYEENPKIKLLLVGSFEQVNGILPEEIKKLIKTHPAIIYPGRADDIRPWLFMSDCLVFPSFREGFPAILLEAGSMKLPIIASDINGNNDLIDHDYSGLLFAPKSKEALYRSMKQVLSSSDETLNFYQANLHTVIQEKFSNKVVWEAVYNEYIRLMKIKKTG